MMLDVGPLNRRTPSPPPEDWDFSPSDPWENMEPLKNNKIGRTSGSIFFYATPFHVVFAITVSQCFPISICTIPQHHAAGPNPFLSRPMQALTFGPECNRLRLQNS
jgi:hypothetical protein